MYNRAKSEEDQFGVLFFMISSIVRRVHLKNIKTNTLTTILLLALLCIIIEGMIFENGMIFSAVLGAFFIYISLKRQKKKLFWLGIIFLLLALLSMWSLRLLIGAVIIYILWKMLNGEPIQVSVHPNEERRTPDYVLNKNKLFQFDDTLNETYVWQDVHHQNLAGEVMIDTTNTILPKGTSIITIRQGFGKMTVVVPYEIPLRVHFNTVVGEATILKEKYPRLWNEALSIKNGYSPDFVAERELVITASSFFGDLEVIRR